MFVIDKVKHGRINVTVLVDVIAKLGRDKFLKKKIRRLRNESDNRV